MTDENKLITMALEHAEATLEENSSSLFVDDEGFDYSTDDVVAHYGVPGMHWGRRKDKTPVKPSTDRKQSDQARVKPLPSMTNKQLKTVNNRLQLEKTYKDLTREPTALDKIKKGNATATTILATVGIGVSVYNLAKSPAGQAAIKKGALILKNARSAAG